MMIPKEYQYREDGLFVKALVFTAATLAAPDLTVAISVQVLTS
jgi:hypothetical protein